MTDDSIPQRRCAKCGEEKPLTAEYWHKKKNNPQGYNTACKPCNCAASNTYYHANTEIIAVKSHAHYLANIDVIAERSRAHYAANAEEYKKRYRAYYVSNKEAIKNRVNGYRIANPDIITERKRIYYAANAEAIKKKALDWYFANHERAKARSNAYYLANYERASKQRRSYYIANYDVLKAKRLARYAANPGTIMAIYQRRRARKLALPDTLTAQQIDHAYAYFHCTCAVCGSQLRDLFGDVKPHLDHWIPLSYKGADNPGTVAVNMLCLCSKCNLSKKDRIPGQWLIIKFGKGRAKTILDRINTYFASLLSER
jgi:5-methylcytosine-specific restriction endonuclease McrA